MLPIISVKLNHMVKLTIIVVADSDSSLHSLTVLWKTALKLKLKVTCLIVQGIWHCTNFLRLIFLYKNYDNSLRPNYPNVHYSWTKGNIMPPIMSCTIVNLMVVESQLQSMTKSLPKCYLHQQTWEVSDLSYCDFVFKSSLSQLITVPTHSQGNKLDVVFTDLDDSISDLWVRSIPVLLSDHLNITFSLLLKRRILLFHFLPTLSQLLIS